MRAAVADEGVRAAPLSVRLQQLATLLVVLVALVPRCLTAGHFQTADEALWMARSQHFSNALAHGDLGAATATSDGLATMPGVTTMWLGSLSRVVWSGGRSLGVWSTHGEEFADSASALHLAQLAVALAVSLLIGVIVVLARRWAGPIVALTAGILLATEPFLVAHGALLHTDELEALFGAAGVLAMLVLLDLPSRGQAAAWKGRRRHSRPLAAVAGVLLACAFLTKVSALLLAPGLLAIIGCAAWRDIRESQRRGEARAVVNELVATLAIVAGAGIVTVALLWPAAAVDPFGQFDLLRESAELGATGHSTFFLGQTTTTPGPLFYAVALPLRMTPWMLVATGAGTVVALAARRGRHRALCMLVMVAPALVVLSFALKQFDRYAIIVLPFLAVVVGIAVEDLALRLGRVGLTPGQRAMCGVAAGVGLAAYSFTVVPWGLAYYNPLLGGGATAERAVVVGWGEGFEHFGKVIAEREAGGCNETVVLTQWGGTDLDLGCGRVKKVLIDPWALGGSPKADYLLVYVSWRQRLETHPQEYKDLVAHGRLVYRLTVRGIDYGELYALDPPGRRATPSKG